MGELDVAATEVLKPFELALTTEEEGMVELTETGLLLLLLLLIVAADEETTTEDGAV